MTTIEQQAEDYLSSLPVGKQADMRHLHALMLQLLPGARLWFDSGVNAGGRVVTNPTIGYGFFVIKYANGTTRHWFQTGISANKSGISVYLMGIDNRNYLPQTYGQTIGKAHVSGYCIKFNHLKDIDEQVLAVRNGVKITSVA